MPSTRRSRRPFYKRVRHRSVSSSWRTRCQCMTTLRRSMRDRRLERSPSSTGSRTWAFVTTWRRQLATSSAFSQRTTTTTMRRSSSRSWSRWIARPAKRNSWRNSTVRFLTLCSIGIWRRAKPPPPRRLWPDSRPKGWIQWWRTRLSSPGRSLFPSIRSVRSWSLRRATMWKRRALEVLFGWFGNVVWVWVREKITNKITWIDLCLVIMSQNLVMIGNN